MGPAYRLTGLVLLILLAGCGQKGDLVLPEADSQASAVTRTFHP